MYRESGRLAVNPMKGYNGSIRLGAINQVLAGLVLVDEHPHAYVAYVGVLGCPLTHLCLQECKSIACE